MFGPHLGKAMVLGLAVGLFGACGGGSSATPGMGGSTAGTTGAAGIAGGAGSGGGAGSAGAGGVPNDGGLDAPTGAGGTGLTGTCVQAPAPLRSSGTILELPFELVYEGRPFVYGEPNMITGQSVIPTNLRFYVSQVALVGPSGATTAVDIVTSAGAPQPYGVFLFNAESADAQTLRVLAPPGGYDGLTFALGLTPACNQGSASGRAFPLSADSQMTWPIPIGYLFLRYESLVTGDAGAGAAALPRAIHMGGDVADLNRPGAIAVRVTGALSVPAGGSARQVLRVAMDQIFKGATTDVDLSGFPFASAGDEVAGGERLRRTGAGLPLFTFAP